jgi:hypothetical protein
MRILYDMTTIIVTPDRVRIELSVREKVGGLVRDLDVPASAVRSVSVVPDGLAAARGIRAPGLGIPGVRKIGTWRRRGGKTLVSVRRGRPAVLLLLDGARFDRVLVEVDQPQVYVDQLRAMGISA